MKPAGERPDDIFSKSSMDLKWFCHGTCPTRQPRWVIWAFLTERVQGRRPRPHMETPEWPSCHPLNPPIPCCSKGLAPGTPSRPWTLPCTLSPGDTWTGDVAKAPSTIYCSQWSLLLSRAVNHGQILPHTEVQNCADETASTASQSLSRLPLPTDVASLLHLSHQVLQRQCTQLQKHLRDWQRFSLGQHDLHAGGTPFVMACWAPADQAHSQLSLAHWWHLHLIQAWSIEYLFFSPQHSLKICKTQSVHMPSTRQLHNYALSYVRFFGISVQKLYFIHPPKHSILVQVGTQAASKTTIKWMRIKFPFLFSFPRQSGEAEHLLKLSLAQLWCPINGVLPYQWSSSLFA